ncbi:MAG: T9SS type A sorting domain-containing protein [Bacteroidales bacterium]|nr:T9SS type A sorting domain-containing protein [Bacteroidales bacterium]
MKELVRYVVLAMVLGIASIAIKAAEGVPSRPVIESVNLEYTFDYDNVSIYPNGTLTVDFTSYDFWDDICEIVFFYTPGCDFELEGRFRIRLDFEPEGTEDAPFGTFFRLDENRYRFVHEKAEWGQFAWFGLVNSSGSSEFSDTICTTDYIYDPDVLEAIHNWGKGNSVQLVPKDEMLPQISPTTIKFNTPNHLECCRIFDLLGREKSVFVKSNSIDISNLPAGLYILFYSFNGKNHSQKFLKP